MSPLNKLLRKVKKHCIGFLCVTTIKDHYTGASHRIFLLTKYGPACIMYFDNGSYQCKNKSLQKEIS